MDVLPEQASSMSRSTVAAPWSEKAKRERRLPAHSFGRILQPRQQGVSGRNEVIAYALADQPQRVAGAAAPARTDG